MTIIKNDNIIKIEKGGVPMKLSDVITNPVRMKIMQFLQGNTAATTKQISEAIPDVPAPTLYRHINYLLKEEVLIVKEERKVRGSLERLLAFNENKWTGETSSDISDAASAEIDHLQLAHIRQGIDRCDRGIPRNHSCQLRKAGKW